MTREPRHRVLHRYTITALLLLNVIGLLANIYYGSVHIPASNVTEILLGMSDGSPWQFIVLQSRMPAALTALLAGAALGVCGLLLQSYFRNPLAGPSILGITSGANLAVAICILSIGVISNITLVSSALIGAFAILFILLGIGRIVRHHVTLLIVGIFISYLGNAIITLLNYYATADGTQSLLFWGMGSFNGVGMDNLLIFTNLICAGLLISILLIKPLNGWMLGEDYAVSLGINVTRTRYLILICTGLLAATVTAFCGPISFVGLSVPHVARMLTHTDNHRYLLPISALLGGICCSLCLFISSLPNNGNLIPLNALTPLFGVPVVIYVLLKR